MEWIASFSQGGNWDSCTAIAEDERGGEECINPCIRTRTESAGHADWIRATQNQHIKQAPLPSHILCMIHTITFIDIIDQCLDVNISYVKEIVAERCSTET